MSTRVCILCCHLRTCDEDGIALHLDKGSECAPCYKCKNWFCYEHLADEPHHYDHDEWRAVYLCKECDTTGRTT